MKTSHFMIDCGMCQETLDVGFCQTPQQYYNVLTKRVRNSLIFAKKIITIISDRLERMHSREETILSQNARYT